jgi:hypothetical protein
MGGGGGALNRLIRKNTPFLGLHARATDACTSPRTRGGGDAASN